MRSSGRVLCAGWVCAGMTFCGCGVAGAQPARRDISEDLRRVLTQEPTGAAARDREAVIAFARELAEAGDRAKRDGQPGYSRVWRRAADLAFARGERGLASSLYARTTDQGEDELVRAGACVQLMRWYCGAEERVNRGREKIAVMDAAPPGVVTQDRYADVVELYAQGLSESGRRAEAIEARATAKARFAGMAPDRARTWAKMELASAGDHARLGRREDAWRCFDEAFVVDPTLASDSHAPLHALAFCQTPHPDKARDPGYAADLLRLWSRPDIRVHPLSVYLASQAALAIVERERGAELGALAQDVIDAAPGWLANWQANPKRRESEAESVREHLHTIVLRAQSMDLGTVAQELRQVEASLHR